ncbi:hypothetical protein [Streptomyces sp. NPDC058653]
MADWLVGADPAGTRPRVRGDQGKLSVVRAVPAPPVALTAAIPLGTV